MSSWYNDISDIEGITTYPQLSYLSATSVALILIALSNMNKRYLWRNNGISLLDGEWDVVSDYFGLALTEVMESLMIGDIYPTMRVINENEGRLLCDGRILNRVEFPQLYAVTAPELIIDSDTFRIPDLRERFVFGKGVGNSLNDVGGAEDHTLTIDEIPAHSHDYGYPSIGIDLENVGAPDVTAVGNPPTSLSTSLVGGGLPHNNMPPFCVLAYVVVAR